MPGLQQFDLNASASLKDSWLLFSPVQIPLPSPPFYPWNSWQQLHLPPDSARGCSIPHSVGSQAPSSSHFLHPPLSSSTLADQNSQEASPKPLEHLHLHGNSSPGTSSVWEWTAIVTAPLVLSTACATFSKRSLHSARNSMEYCALFHWILSHFLHSNPQGHSVLHIQLLCIYESSELGIISQVLSAHTKFLHQNH